MSEFYLYHICLFYYQGHLVVASGITEGWAHKGGSFSFFFLYACHNLELAVLVVGGGRVN